jgi:hypothetical protein
MTSLKDPFRSANPLIRSLELRGITDPSAFLLTTTTTIDQTERTSEMTPLASLSTIEDTAQKLRIL